MKIIMIKLLFFCVLLGSIEGCTINKVSPWQRGNLAKQVMIRDGGGQHMALEQHAYSSKETTSGGYSVGAGGCGCN